MAPVPRASSSINESTPLLGSESLLTQPNEQVLQSQRPTSNDPNNDSSNEDAEENKPLPKLQIFFLCYARILEPIAYFSIFPFINKMVLEMGLDEADVGFYSGLIESLFSLTQMFLMIPWGRAADRFGRKPVLVASLAGQSIAMAMFGFSKAVWQMILFRCLAGAFAGTVVTIRTMVSENSTRKTQARAFSFFALSSNLGIFVGPVLGGALAEPAKNFPIIFGRIQIFKDYPYALPTVVVGVIGLSAVAVSALFIKETLDKGLVNDTTSSPPMTTWELNKQPGVATVLYLYGHTMLLAFAYTAVLPLFWFTDVKYGGLGFTPFQISMFLAAIGISQLLWVLIVFPIVQLRYGTGWVLRICSYAWPITFASWPLCNFLLRHDLKVAFWIIAPTGLAIGSGVSIAFTAIQLAINDISPSPATLGTLNAIALAVSSAVRTIGPYSFSSIFAIGVRTGVMGGYLGWFVLVLLALSYTVGMMWLPAKAEGRQKKVAETN